jgi:hypothetical protein
MDQQTVTKPVEPPPETVEHGWIKPGGPFWLAIAISAAGVVYLLLGSLTIVPWISDERERATVRSVWIALSRNLPDIGLPTLERAGFWLLVALVAVLCVALMIAASAAGEDDTPDPGTLA